MITQLAYKQSVTECVTECVTVCVTECVTACVTECLSKACLFLLTTKSNITNYTNKTTHNHKYKTTNMIVLFLLLNKSKNKHRTQGLGLLKLIVYVKRLTCRKEFDGHTEDVRIRKYMC
jgi:hypothetical protein